MSTATRGRAVSLAYSTTLRATTEACTPSTLTAPTMLLRHAKTQFCTPTASSKILALRTALALAKVKAFS